MKDLGAAKKILGMEITRFRDRGKLVISQKGYLSKVVKWFNMDDAKPTSVPLAAHFRLSSTQSPDTIEDKEQVMKVPYANAIGSIMYAMVCTRPDISHAVSVTSRFMGNPGKEHWQAVKWVLRYLKGTQETGLVYCRGSDTSQQVQGFVDSDYAGDLDKRRSLTGYAFTLFGNTISWKASLQHIVALSTTEA